MVNSMNSIFELNNYFKLFLTEQLVIQFVYDTEIHSILIICKIWLNLWEARKNCLFNTTQQINRRQTQYSNRISKTRALNRCFWLLCQPYTKHRVSFIGKSTKRHTTTIRIRFDNIYNGSNKPQRRTYCDSIIRESDCQIKFFGRKYWHKYKRTHLRSPTNDYLYFQ